jgi:hypothetical protein
MEWFSARARFHSTIGGEEQPDDLCEWVVYLVSGETTDEVGLKAEAIGRGNETSYQNEDGNLVSWVFEEIEEIQSLCETDLYDGMEVYSRLYRRNGPSE